MIYINDLLLGFIIILMFIIRIVIIINNNRSELLKRMFLNTENLEAEETMVDASTLNESNAD